MPRTSILETTKSIIKLLSNGKSLSIKTISEEIDARWETTLKCLEFLKDINLVKENKGEKFYKATRLFSLKR